MKTAIYIEDGVVQLVLTPESEFEKNAMSGFADKNLTAQVFEGTFYDCRGGWTRQAHFEHDRYMYGDRRPPQDQSIILRVEQRSTHVPEVVVDESVNRRSMEATLQRANGPVATPPMPTMPIPEAGYAVPAEPQHVMAMEATTVGYAMVNEERPMIRMDTPNEMPPACGADCLDISRAKHNTESYGDKVHRVSAPCCGTALIVRCRVVVMAEVEVDTAPSSKHDDWGVPYGKTRRKETHESVIENAYRDHTGQI